jgi:hypothetical protein
MQNVLGSSGQAPSCQTPSRSSQTVLSTPSVIPLYEQAQQQPVVPLGKQFTVLQFSAMVKYPPKALHSPIVDVNGNNKSEEDPVQQHPFVPGNRNAE